MLLTTSLSWAVALALPCLSEAAAAKKTGEFNVLSMNVAGIPAFLNPNGVPGDKKTNSRTIGSKLAEFGHDVVHLQEDFNYHAYIYETDDHPHRTATTGGVIIGSGLNTVANYPWDLFDRVTWDDCGINEADCLTPKGFSMMRVRLDEDVAVDMYNVHADAGYAERDAEARTSNFKQVAAYMASHSTDNAVIVLGDTNFLYTDEGEYLRAFLDETKLRDPWVDLVLDGVPPAEGAQNISCENPTTVDTCEVLDKVLYRSGVAVDLEATYFGYESARFVQENGDILTDHIPVTANFTWSLCE